MSRPYKWPFTGHLRSVTILIPPEQVLTLNTAPVIIVPANSDIAMILPALTALHKPPGAAYTTTASLVFDVNGSGFSSAVLNSDAGFNITSPLERVYCNRPAAGTITQTLGGFPMTVKSNGAITGTGALPPIKVHLTYWLVDPRVWDIRNPSLG